MKKAIGTLIFSSAVLMLDACKSNSDAVSPTTTTTSSSTATVTFATVNTIFVASCSGSGCHNTTEGPLFVNNYSIAKANGALIVSEVVSKKMPEVGSLTTAEIAAIKQWQTDGFLEK